jgi:hypothetical protein
MIMMINQGSNEGDDTGQRATPPVIFDRLLRVGIVEIFSLLAGNGHCAPPHFARVDEANSGAKEG